MTRERKEERRGEMRQKKRRRTERISHTATVVDAHSSVHSYRPRERREEIRAG
jgi:hypothetical protein